MNKDEGLFKCPLKKSAIDSGIGIMSLVIKMTGYAKKPPQKTMLSGPP